MSASAAIVLVRRMRETGSTALSKVGGYRQPVLDQHADLLGELATKRGLIAVSIITQFRDEIVKALR